MDAPPFPVDTAGLAPWAVYADHLLSRGDPMGELIARDLAIDEHSSPEALHAMQVLGRRLCRTSPRVEVAYCLGHARSISLHTGHMGKLVNGAGSFEREALQAALHLLESPKAQRLESFWVDRHQTFDSTMWGRLSAALPPSCSRLGMVTTNVALEDLPAVRELVLMTGSVAAAERFLDDRFEVVYLPGLRLSSNDSGAVFAALARTARVRVRINNCEVAIPHEFEARVLLGSLSDAALRGVEGAAHVALPRPSLFELQRRHGLVSVRAQLGRWLCERWGLRGRAEAIPFGGSHLARHAGGRWTVRTFADQQQEEAGDDRMVIQLNGERLDPGSGPHALELNDILSLNGDDWRFVPS